MASMVVLLSCSDDEYKGYVGCVGSTGLHRKCVDFTGECPDGALSADCDCYEMIKDLIETDSTLSPNWAPMMSTHISNWATSCEDYCSKYSYTNDRESTLLLGTEIRDTDTYPYWEFYTDTINVHLPLIWFPETYRCDSLAAK